MISESAIALHFHRFALALKGDRASDNGLYRSSSSKSRRFGSGGFGSIKFGMTLIFSTILLDTIYTNLVGH